MHLLLRNLSPECHGLIKQHQAEHGFKNLDETIESLVWMAKIDWPERVMELESKIQRMHR